MPLTDFATSDLVLLLAAFAAGVLNAIAGGGSFLTFPALVYAGVPPIPANATSAVAVFPGYIGSVLGFRPELQAMSRRTLMLLTAISLAGGLIGALLLLMTPAKVFSFLVPWLLLFATAVFAFGPGLVKKLAGADTDHPAARTVGALAVSIYGGYFNGGLGIMLMALFAATGWHQTNLMNAMKNWLSTVLSAISVAAFAAAGVVQWREALIMALAATVGGYVGARWSRRLPAPVVRGIVIVVGLAMAAAFWARG